MVKPGSLQRARLDNGLEILVLEDHRLPLVSLGLSFRRGEAMLGLSWGGGGATQTDDFRSQRIRVWRPEGAHHFSAEGCQTCVKPTFPTSALC